MDQITCCIRKNIARLAQSVERETLNLNVVGSSPTLGGTSFSTFAKFCFPFDFHNFAT